MIDERNIKVIRNLNNIEFYVISRDHETFEIFRKNFKFSFFATL